MARRGPGSAEQSQDGAREEPKTQRPGNVQPTTQEQVRRSKYAKPKAILQTKHRAMRETSEAALWRDGGFKQSIGQIDKKDELIGAMKEHLRASPDEYRRGGGPVALLRAIREVIEGQRNVAVDNRRAGDYRNWKVAEQALGSMAEAVEKVEHRATKAYREHLGELQTMKATHTASTVYERIYETVEAWVVGVGTRVSYHPAVLIEALGIASEQVAQDISGEIALALLEDDDTRRTDIRRDALGLQTVLRKQGKGGTLFDRTEQVGVLEAVARYTRADVRGVRAAQQAFESEVRYKGEVRTVGGSAREVEVLKSLDDELAGPEVEGRDGNDTKGVIVLRREHVREPSIFDSVVKADRAIRKAYGPEAVVKWDVDRRCWYEGAILARTNEGTERIEYTHLLRNYLHG